MKKLIVYIPEDHQHLPYIDHRQYTEEELSIVEVLGAIEAVAMQLRSSTLMHIMAQMDLEKQKQEEQ